MPEEVPQLISPMVRSFSCTSIVLVVQWLAHVLDGGAAHVASVLPCTTVPGMYSEDFLRYQLVNSRPRVLLRHVPSLIRSQGSTHTDRKDFPEATTAP